MDINGLERELSGALENIMLGETRLWLLKTLLSLKLVTWDIYYFRRSDRILGRSVSAGSSLHDGSHGTEILL